jgi:hypothetical protein
VQYYHHCMMFKFASHTLLPYHMVQHRTTTISSRNDHVCIVIDTNIAIISSTDLQHQHTNSAPPFTTPHNPIINMIMPSTRKHQQPHRVCISIETYNIGNITTSSSPST